MVCPVCRVDSTTTDVCSFCRHPFETPQNNAAQPTAAMPPAIPTLPVQAAPQTMQGLPPHPAPPIGLPPMQMTPGSPAVPTMGLPPQYANAPAPANYLQPTQAMAPQAPTPPRTEQRVSLTGEVIEVSVAPPPTTVHSPMQHGQPLGANLGSHIQRYEPVREIPSVVEEPGVCWEKFLAIGLPILALSMLGVHLYPGMAAWIGLADLILLSTAMSGTCAIPSYDDNMMDIGMALALCFFFGPVIAGVALLVVGLIRQEAAAAVLSLISLICFLRLTLGSVLVTSPDMNAGSFFTFHALFNPFGFLNLFAFSLLVFALGAWMLGNLFRPIGESL